MVLVQDRELLDRLDHHFERIDVQMRRGGG